MRVDEHTKAALARVEMSYQRFTVARITNMVPAIPTINEPGERFRVRAPRRFEACATPCHAGLRGFRCSAVIFPPALQVL